MSNGITDGLRRDRAMERRIALDKSLQEPIKSGPHFGGLITDPLPAKVRKLEERVTVLESFAFKMLQHMDSQNAK